MRILHCIPGMLVGGAERQVSLLAPAQATAGSDVHVALVKGGHFLGELLDSSVAVHRIEARGNHDPQIGMALFRLMRSLKPAIVQTWLPQMDVFGGIAAILSSTRWVLSERSMAQAYRTRLKETVLRRAVAYGADAIVANSTQGLNYWVSRARKSTLRRLVRNALPVKEILLARPRSAILANAPPDVPVILFVGRLSTEKNIPVFLRALAIVARERRIKALLCGEGPLRGDVVRLIDDLGLHDCVILGGLCDDVWYLMQSASMFVNPSNFEGQPNAVLEAAAAGVPLVLSDIAGHREIADDFSALFFSPHSPDELATGIRRALDDHAETDLRKERARERVNEYSIERCVSEYQSIYDELLSR